MDSHAVHTAQQAQQLLRSHLEAIRSDPFLQSAWIILIYEKNTGYESGHHWKIVQEYQPSYAVYHRVVDADKAVDTQDQDPGINTTFELKNYYARALSTALSTSRIYFYFDWKSANPWQRPYEERKAIAKKNFLGQLSNCRLKLPSMDPSKAQLGATIPKITWSGKIGPEGKIIQGQNDDLVMAFAQCLYWISRIMQFNYPSFPYEKVFAGIGDIDSIKINF